MTIKEHHKTLEARLAKLEVPLNVGSITASEIAQEQATSAAANQARIDRELAAMRARIEKLERDQGKGQQGSNRQ